MFRIFNEDAILHPEQPRRQQQRQSFNNKTNDMSTLIIERVFVEHF